MSLDSLNLMLLTANLMINCCMEKRKTKKMNWKKKKMMMMMKKKNLSQRLHYLLNLNSKPQNQPSPLQKFKQQNPQLRNQNLQLSQLLLPQKPNLKKMNKTMKILMILKILIKMKKILMRMMKMRINKMKKTMKSQPLKKLSLNKENHNKVSLSIKTKINSTKASPSNKIKDKEDTKEAIIKEVIIKEAIIKEDSKVESLTGIINIKATTKEASHSLTKVGIISNMEESHSTKTSIKSIDHFIFIYVYSTQLFLYLSFISHLTFLIKIIFFTHI